MVAKIYYNLDFFDQKSIEALIARFHRILEQMAADPTRKVGEIL